MSDINLRINGNADGAVGAFNEAGDAATELGDDVGKSVVKWQELANVAKKAAEMVVRFGIDAVKAYAESERVQRQLTRAAGEYSDALGDQAEALSKLYAVDDDIIKQSEILLTQWGGVGAATKEVEQAVLNYAAATGQDAVAATQDLIRNVESGGVGLAKLGVHFTETGDKGKDLAAAVAALNAKFGGAAAADAASLSGSLKGATLAFDDLQKNIGESIAGFLQETGAIAATTEALRGLSEFITQKHTQALLDEEIKTQSVALATRELALAQQSLKEAMADPNVSLTVLEQFSDDVTRAQKNLDALVGSSKDLALPGIGSVTGTTNKAQHEAAAESKKAGVELTKRYIQEETEAVRDGMAEQSVLIQQQNEEALEADRQMYAQSLELQRKAQDAEEKAALDSWKQKAAMEKKATEDMLKAEEELEKRNSEEARKNIEAKEKQWKATGDQIGAAFVNALSEQLSKLADGGEFDAAQFVGSILSAVFSIAASAIGTAYGMPALGAAIGNLGSMGIQAGFGELSKSNKRGANLPKKFHSGGWVGDEATLPRYHSGSWIGADEHAAILQSGERVLSRQEVQAMGGQNRVDSAARGGSPGLVVNISALNAKSVAESVETDFGLGLRRALRSGRGNVGLMGMVPG